MADRLPLMRLEQLLASLLQMQSVLAAFGQVSGCLGEPDQLVVAEDGIDDHIAQKLHHAELATVLAHPPALGHEAAGIACSGQGLVGQARRTVFFSVETGERPADDLARLIALDALRSGVPAYDLPIQVGYEDGATPKCLDQQLADILG